MVLDHDIIFVLATALEQCMSFPESAALLAHYCNVKHSFTALEARHTSIKITYDFCSITEKELR